VFSFRRLSPHFSLVSLPFCNSYLLSPFSCERVDGGHIRVFPLAPWKSLPRNLFFGWPTFSELFCSFRLTSFPAFPPPSLTLSLLKKPFGSAERPTPPFLAFHYRRQAYECWFLDGSRIFFLILLAPRSLFLSSSPERRPTPVQAAASKVFFSFNNQSEPRFRSDPRAAPPP